MDRIPGLRDYIRLPRFRQALGIPDRAELEPRLLAQGEYNINYVFAHPVTGRKLVLRVNAGSQMHLADQIGYEYNALRLLERSGRTPQALYVDGSRESLPYGVMVMGFLPGRALDYRRDMAAAAACLADIHSVPVDGPASGLLAPEDPLGAILDECEQMVQTYYGSPLADAAIKRRIERLLAAGRAKAAAAGNMGGYRCCINTELNSGNFLINGPGQPSYLVDWEKPLFGDPAQDLGHFLAPTTTFWKTDVILSPEEMDAFTGRYRQAAAGRFDTDGLEEKLALYIPITCLRGVTWCAMAWVQYQQPDRLIRNEDTFRKMEAYLSADLLDMMERRYFCHFCRSYHS